MPADHVMLIVASSFIGIVGEQGDLVALRIAQVANIEVRSIRRTEAGLTFVGPACGERGGVEVTNLLLTMRLESDHGPVTSRGRTSIEGWLDIEVGRNRRLTRLCRQCVTQALGALLEGVAKGRQKRGIKPFRACDVIRTDRDIGNHASCFFPDLWRLHSD